VTSTAFRLAASRNALKRFLASPTEGLSWPAPRGPLTMSMVATLSIVASRHAAGERPARGTGQRGSCQEAAGTAGPSNTRTVTVSSRFGSPAVADHGTEPASDF
jgi:hypothetical protein